MGDLSKNFSLKEFICKCGKDTCDAKRPHPSLVKGLQELRDQTGRSITILSAGRCKEHNRKVGGSPTSEHLPGADGYCRAADIVIDGYDGKQMYLAAKEIEVFKHGGLGIYPREGFIHVDVRGTYARWARVKRGVGPLKRSIYVSIEEGLNDFNK